jgi:hypothetical protein
VVLPTPVTIKCPASSYVLCRRVNRRTKHRARCFGAPFVFSISKSTSGVQHASYDTMRFLFALHLPGSAVGRQTSDTDDLRVFGIFRHILYTHVKISTSTCSTTRSSAPLRSQTWLGVGLRRTHTVYSRRKHYIHLQHDRRDKYDDGNALCMDDENVAVQIVPKYLKALEMMETGETYNPDQCPA